MAKRVKKNFLITLIFFIFFWFSLVFMIFFVEPELIKDLFIPNSYFIFIINLFLTIFFTLAILLGNSRRSLLITLGLIILLFLRLFRLENWLNIILTIACIFTLEYYFTREK